MDNFFGCRPISSTYNKVSCVNVRVWIEITPTGVVTKSDAKSGSRKPRVSYPGSAVGGAYPVNFSSRSRAKQLRQLSCLYGAPLPMSWTDAVLNLSPEQVQRSITQARWLSCHQRFKIRAFRRLLWLLLTGDYSMVKKADTKSANGAPTVSASTTVQLQLPI